jgi:hypothetical protein
VGAALNVHEGPQSISFRYGNMTPLLKGMIVSNEPGYYEDHAFGIRIEVCSFSYSFMFLKIHFSCKFTGSFTICDEFFLLGSSR